MAEDLSVYFLVNDHKWRIGGERVVPNASDIQKVIDHVLSVLDKEESEDVQLEIGRLLFKKREGVIDVYTYYGTLNDD